MRMMKTTLTLCLTLALATSAFSQQSHQDELANLPFPNGYPTAEAADTLLDELAFQRAVQTYLWSLPAMNMYAMREGQKKTFGAESNVLAIWKDRIDHNTLITTANPDVIYAFAWLDLKKEGPMVLDMPPGLQGLLDDMWHRPLTDIGAAGPDKGKGGKFLILPPGYEENAPDGYYVVRSPTYGVFVFLRAFLNQGKTDKGVALLEQSRIYPVSKADNPLTMKFPNASGVPMDGDFPRSVEYFERLAEFINYETVSREDFAMRGMLAGIGIVKGQPFEPDSKLKALLDKAGQVGFKMAAAVDYEFRPSPRIYPDRNWEQVFIGGSPVFEADTYHNQNASIAFFHKAYSTSKAMVIAMPGKGSQYLLGLRDEDGSYLTGEYPYRVHLPPNVPAANYWSVVLYDADTRALLDNGQPFPSVASNQKLTLNEDGSADIHLGPTAPQRKDANWIKTVPGKGYFVGMRLYSPTKAFFDQTWKPDDIRKLEGAAAVAEEKRGQEKMETRVTRIGELKFENGYPNHETLENLYDERDFQRACQAYIWSLPAVSMMEFVNSYQNDLGARFGDLISITTFEDASYGITANATTQYLFGWYDLTVSGPVVIDEPAGAMAGFVNDMWQRPVVDLGIPGKYAGKGGKQLLVGPGQDVPEDTAEYNVVRSRSNYTFILTRILETDPDKSKAVLSGFQMYPYKDRANPKVTKIIPVGGRKWSSNQPRGMAYWERFSEFLNHEPVEERDRFFTATLVPLGFEKGKPFKPTDRQRKLLEEGVFVGEAMAGANNFHSRFAIAFYAPGTKWDLALAHNLDQRAEHYNQLDERAAWYYEALTSSEGMTSSRPGVGSTYLGGYRDKDDEWLDGAKSYKLRVPADVPAKRFWSVTVYHNDTRYLIQNGQRIADRSSRMDLLENDDRLIDIYFGPTPPRGKENNWIPTVPGQGWFSYFRIYGPLESYFDRSWILPDIQKLKE